MTWGLGLGFGNSQCSSSWEASLPEAKAPGCDSFWTDLPADLLGRDFPGRALQRM
jgi:hypothetical protein